MNDVQIRKATLNDLETLLRFEQSIIEAERPFDATLKQGAIHYYDLESLITSNHVQLLVAESDNTVVGCGYARLEKAKPYLHHEHYAYLGFMYVLPEYRGKGINQKIIATLKEWAYARGITELRLEVYADNLPAVKAYEKAGFQPLMLLMRMDDSAEVK